MHVGNRFIFGYHNILIEGYNCDRRCSELSSSYYNNSQLLILCCGDHSHCQWGDQEQGIEVLNATNQFYS